MTHHVPPAFHLSSLDLASFLPLFGRDSNKKAELPEVNPSAARPSSQKIRGFPSPPSREGWLYRDQWIPDRLMINAAILVPDSYYHHKPTSSRYFFETSRFVENQEWKRFSQNSPNFSQEKCE